MKGIFITFEGIEGVGKSTLMNNIALTLSSTQKNVVTTTREPGGTLLGEQLRNIVLSHQLKHVRPMAELLIMFAARAQHIAEFIQPALDAGHIVLCDRFSDTSRAYQGGGRQVPMAWINTLIQMTHANLNPNITFWIDLSPEIALRRAKKRSASDRIEQEKIDFFKRAHTVYAQLALEEPHRIIRLDGTLAPKMLLEQAMSIILPHIQ